MCSNFGVIPVLFSFEEFEFGIVTVVPAFSLSCVGFSFSLSLSVLIAFSRFSGHQFFRWIEYYKVK